MLSCFDPLGNATHTALSFDVLGEDVLITGAGPIGCMAAAIAKHVGARYVVVTDVNPYRLELARKMGATLAVDVRRGRDCGRPEEARHEGGLRRGAGDVRQRRRPSATCSTNMCHGGKIALLGILPADTADRLEHRSIFNGLTLKGIYGREMYETWYKMTVMLQSGLDISPVITHRFHYTEFEKGSR